MPNILKKIKIIGQPKKNENEMFNKYKKVSERAYNMALIEIEYIYGGPTDIYISILPIITYTLILLGAPHIVAKYNKTKTTTKVPPPKKQP